MVQLQGIIPALVTPLHADGTFDNEGCRRLVEHVISGGVHGVLALGSTGEVAALDEHTRRQVVDGVATALAGRIPLTVGVAQMNLNDALRDIQAAAAGGAAAVLVVPPYYGPIDQQSVLTFYRKLAEKSPLPILAYNIPPFTKVVVQPATLAKLADEGVVVGVKDSSHDFEYFQQVLALKAARGDFLVLQGIDTMLLTSLVMGASGAITVSANLVPALGVGIYETVARGDWASARVLQGRLIQVVLALRAGVFPAGIKAALALASICGDTVAFPASSLSATERSAMAAVLRKLDIWKEAPTGRILGP